MNEHQLFALPPPSSAIVLHLPTPALSKFPTRLIISPNRMCTPEKVRMCHRENCLMLIKSTIWPRQTPSMTSLIRSKPCLPSLASLALSPARVASVSRASPATCSTSVAINLRLSLCPPTSFVVPMCLQQVCPVLHATESTLTEEANWSRVQVCLSSLHFEHSSETNSGRKQEEISVKLRGRIICVPSKGNQEGKLAESRLTFVAANAVQQCRCNQVGSCQPTCLRCAPCRLPLELQFALPRKGKINLPGKRRRGEYVPTTAEIDRRRRRQRAPDRADWLMNSTNMQTGPIERSYRCA